MVRETIGYDIAFTNGIVANVDSVNSTPYSIAPTGEVHPYYIDVDTSSTAITVNLPTTSNNGLELGREYNIIDQGGNASVNNITIDAGSGNTINGSQTVIINSNYTVVKLLCTSSSPITWNIV